MLRRVARLREHLSGAFAALHGVFGNPGLRRVTLAYAGSAFGLYAYSVVVAVYSYHHGGATAVGLVLFARLGVSALVAPFASSFADRFPQERVMLCSDVGRIVTVLATAFAAAGGSPALVYVLATLTSVLGTVFHPAEASLIPVLARTPEELTAANVTSSTFDSVGAFAGLRSVRSRSQSAARRSASPSWRQPTAGASSSWRASTCRSAGGRQLSKSRSTPGSPPASVRCVASRACSS